MAVRKVIAINLSESDTDLKAMIRDLSATKTKGVENPYRKRSESEIAKMLLERILTKEHNKFCRKESRQ